MKLLGFLLAIVYIHRGEGCLKVRMVAPPKCECQALGLDGTNIAQHVTDTELLSNLTSYPLQAPIIGVDDCSGTVYCEDGYSLVIVDTDKTTNFDKYAAEGICDPYTQTWQVDDGKQDYGFSTYQRLYGICVKYNPKCACASTVLSDINQITSHLTHTDLLDFAKNYPILPTTSTLEDCAVSYECPQGGAYSVRLFDSEKHAQSWDKVVGSCDPFTQSWNFTIRNEIVQFKSPVYAFCVDEAPLCLCERYRLDETNIADYLKDQDLLNNITKYPMAMPGIIEGCFYGSQCEICELSYGCLDDDYTLILFDDQKSITTSPRGVYGRCSPFTHLWNFTINGESVEFNGGHGVCVKFPPECACASTVLSDINQVATHLTDTELLDEVRKYPIVPPTSTSENCAVSYECPPDDGYLLHLFDSDGKKARAGAEKHVGSCDPFTQSWNFTIRNEVVQFKSPVYAFCVQHAPLCLCERYSLDQTNIADYLKNQDLLNNITKYPMAKPGTVEGCSYGTRCHICEIGYLCGDDDYTLILFDDQKSIQAARGAYGLCSPFTQTWNFTSNDESVEFNAQFSAAHGICVKFPPKCECASLGLSDINQVTSHLTFPSLLEEIAGRPIQAPVTTSTDCTVSYGCPPQVEGWVLIIFDEEKSMKHGPNYIVGTCDSYAQTWNFDVFGIASPFKNPAYAFCVNLA